MMQFIVRMEKRPHDPLTTTSRVYLKLRDGTELEITEIVQTIEIHHGAGKLAQLLIGTPYFRMESVDQ